jgi:hypothetical protein
VKVPTAAYFTAVQQALQLTRAAKSTLGALLVPFFRQLRRVPLGKWASGIYSVRMSVE